MWEVGCGGWVLFLKACKRARRGLAKHKTDFFYYLPPTPYIPHPGEADYRGLCRAIKPRLGLRLR